MDPQLVGLVPLRVEQDGLELHADLAGAARRVIRLARKDGSEFLHPTTEKSR